MSQIEQKINHVVHPTTRKKFDNPLVIKMKKQRIWSVTILTPLQKKYPVDFDDELIIGDVRYDNMT